MTIMLQVKRTTFTITLGLSDVEEDVGTWRTSNRTRHIIGNFNPKSELYFAYNRRRGSSLKELMGCWR